MLNYDNYWIASGISAPAACKVKYAKKKKKERKKRNNFVLLKLYFFNPKL